MEEKFDEKFVENFNLNYDFSEPLFNRFLAKAHLDLDSVKEDVLFEFGCGELVGNDFVINNSGVLFFAIKPQRFVVQSYLTCVRYHGNSMASVVDRKDLYGDLLSLVDEAEAFVKRHTRLAYLFDGFKRIDIEEYPYDAIREAIINAVCHRNYSILNNIFVNVFDDRVEVISPGNIPNDLSLKKVYGLSNPRNFKIFEMFKKVGYIEKLGSGLKRMDEFMLSHGLQKPVIEVNKVFFKVSFFGPKEKILELVKPSNEIDLRNLGLNERQIRALNFLQKKGGLARHELEVFLGTTKRTAIRDLNDLISRGFIKKESKSKKTFYTLSK